MSRPSERAVVDVFFALGDGTRLSVLKKLGASGALSATALSGGERITRQAIVKHLHVLEGAGLVSHQKQGREVLYALEPERLDDARSYLDGISASWDRALERLRRLVEEPAPPPGGRRAAARVQRRPSTR
ncbi:MAG: metalloregulator ArsR/SmtB family transcription factor [Polyangiaceae bacterium]